jgi:hypothetical protein
MANESLILQANTNNGRTAGAMLAYRPSLTGNGIIPVEFPFSRTTTGMEKLADGLWREASINTPRRFFDGTKYSYLFEPARTNHFTHSSDADNGVYSKFNIVKNGDSSTTVIQGVVGRRYDPVGTNVANEFSRSGAFASSINGDITFYFVVEYAGWQWFSLSTNQDSLGSVVWFDLQNGVKGQDTNNRGKIESWGNGVYLLSYTTGGRANGATNTISSGFRSANGSLANITGNGTGLAFHHFQYEAATSYTSPIITAGSAVLRAAEGFSLSDLLTRGIFTSAGGTWVIKFVDNFSYTRDSSIAGLTIGDGPNAFAISNGGTGRLRIGKFVGGGFSQIFLTTTDISYIAIKWDGTTGDVFVNGVKQVSATAFPTANMISFSSANSNDVIKKIIEMKFFPEPISDAECIAETTL